MRFRVTTDIYTPGTIDTGYPVLKKYSLDIEEFSDISPLTNIDYTYKKAYITINSLEDLINLEDALGYPILLANNGYERIIEIRDGT